MTNLEENNHKRTISRLMIGKILASSSRAYLKRSSYEKLSMDFISSAPESDIRISYKLPGTTDKEYSGEIISVAFLWRDQPTELVDAEGNAWLVCDLDIRSTITSTYSITEKEFMTRNDCISSVAELITEIRGIIPGPIKTMIFDNAGRIARDEKVAYDDRCDFIKNYVTHGKYTKNLRVHGRRNYFSREVMDAAAAVCKLKIVSGTYEIKYELGSYRKPIVKKYVVTVPDDPKSQVFIRRIA